MSWLRVLAVPASTTPYGSGLARIRVDGDRFILGGWVRRARRFDHRRTLRYRPGISLEIDDELDSDRHCRYVGRLHFRATLTVSAEGGHYVIRSGKNWLATVEPPDAELRLVRGQEKPLLGWETVARRRMVPAYVLEAHCPGKRRRMQWRVTFGGPPTLGVASLCHQELVAGRGSGGLRFREVPGVRRDLP